MERIPGNTTEEGRVAVEPSRLDPAEIVIAKWKGEMRVKAIEYFQSLRAKGVSPVRHHPLKGRTFIDVTIEGRRFKGQVRNGPLMVSDGPDDTECPLTGASITYGTDFLQTSKQSRWAVCRYRTHQRIVLDGLSPNGIRALACEFGLVVHDDDAAEAVSESECFASSRACVGLQAWARTWPALAKRQLRDHPEFIRGLAVEAKPARKSRYRSIYEFEYFTGS
jgi:hypothetical protein